MSRQDELGTTRREGGFVGRERGERELQQALEEALSGAGRFYLIAGEAGIGKTRLADRVAAQAREARFPGGVGALLRERRGEAILALDPDLPRVAAGRGRRGQGDPLASRRASLDSAAS